MRPRKLLHDETRCHDDTCPDNYRCLRWIQRGEEGEDGSPHITSMRLLRSMEHTCIYRIPLSYATEKSKVKGAECRT